MVAAAGGYSACAAETELYVDAWNFKPCDPRRLDFDCIELAGTYCDAELNICRCWKEDGTKPSTTEKSDQIYCRGACIPVRECGSGHPDAGADAEQDSDAAGEVEASTPEPECNTAADCPGPPSPECGSAACNDGVCELMINPGPLSSQQRGDCKRMDCDAIGNLLTLEDPSDFFDDGRPCTEDLCEGGSPINLPRPEGAYCSSFGSGFCYAGECVECISSFLWTYCPGQLCDDFFCVPMVCDVNNGCGGECAPCPYGGGCTSGADCIDGVCINNMCQDPSCSDVVQNDGETDIDCGGPCATPCADGAGCHAMKDCSSGVCWAGVCQAPACNDGLQNGDETGVDCGGACPACP
jgi:hypothetical protein